MTYIVGIIYIGRRYSVTLVKEFNELEDKWIFYPEGDIDIYNSSVFKKEVVKTFEEKNKDIIIDGKNLNYMDSTGLGALIYILNKLKNNNNEVHLINIKPNIKKILSITELDKLFIIRGDNGE